MNLIIYSIFLYGFANAFPKEKPHVRIIGGEPADISDYPYQVYIEINGDFSCGGSIIGPKHILTAAHCVNELKQEDIVTIKAGITYTSEQGVVKVINKSNIKIHPYYVPDTYDYDVAVLALNDVLVFSERIAPINLPDKSFEVEDEKQGVVTGYGLTTPDGSPSDVLRKVVLPTISTGVCKSFIYPDNITQRMFCAGYVEGKKDSCDGDSGGPLALDGQIIGIVSFGATRCAEPKAPGVYTKVTSVLDFITSAMI